MTYDLVEDADHNDVQHFNRVHVRHPLVQAAYYVYVGILSRPRGHRSLREVGSARAAIVNTMRGGRDQQNSVLSVKTRWSPWPS
jgi:hypothetical protein